MIQFTENDVVRLLPMTAAIESLRRAFTAYGNGEAQNQPRRRLILPTGRCCTRWPQLSEGTSVQRFTQRIRSTEHISPSCCTMLLQPGRWRSRSKSPRSDPNRRGEWTGCRSSCPGEASQR